MRFARASGAQSVAAGHAAHEAKSLLHMSTLTSRRVVYSAQEMLYTEKIRWNCKICKKALHIYYLRDGMEDAVELRKRVGRCLLLLWGRVSTDNDASLLAIVSPVSIKRKKSSCWIGRWSRIRHGVITLDWSPRKHEIVGFWSDHGWWSRWSGGRGRGSW